jgi:pimeloyl-ACP methyl ester carboxylesterase
MLLRLVNFCAGVSLALSCELVGAQDYARETRLAQEVEAQLVVGDIVKITASSGRPFIGLLTNPVAANSTSANSQPADKAILLLHGVGGTPEIGVIGQLRSNLADLGFTTLAIQMTVQGREAKLEDYYPTVFGDAKDRIARAIDWLKTRGFKQIAVVSHSMGAWMMNEYLDENFAKTEISAWVCMSLTGGYSGTARRFPFPILDVYAENDIAPARDSAWRRRLALINPLSRQHRVNGAGPDYSGKEPALAKEIVRFLIN